MVKQSSFEKFVNKNWIIMLLVLIILLLFYGKLDLSVFGGGFGSFFGNSTIFKTCSDYDIAAEFTKIGGATNMAILKQGCQNNGGSWIANSQQVSCHLPNTVSLDCNDPTALQIKSACDQVKATWVCSNVTKFVGCLCKVSAPTQPSNGFTPSNDQPSTCGWHTTTTGPVCSGTCPVGQSCVTHQTLCECINDFNPTQEKNIFLSSLTWSGAMGALDGADMKCQNLAKFSGLGGTWIAFMSAPFADIKDRIMDKAYYRMDGTLVASSKADLLDGTIAAPISIDEKGIAHGGDDYSVWTGTTPGGTNTGTNCHNWGWVDATGTVGDPTATGPNWIDVSAGDCHENKRIYCVRIN